MSKLYFLSFLFFLSSNIFAKHHTISTNLATIIAGNFELSYEYKLKKSASINTLAYFYDSRKLALLRIFSYGYSFGLGVIPKFHPWGKALKNSLYIAPSLKFGYLVHPIYKEITQEERGMLFRTGVNFGYQYILKFGLSFDISAGLEHYFILFFTKPATARQSSRDTSSMFRPIISGSIGYGF